MTVLVKSKKSRIKIRHNIMANITEFKITKHASDRLYERCPDYARLIDSTNIPAIKIKLTYEFVKPSHEENSFLNNSSFMNYMWEKYGFENNYRFFVYENIIYIGIINPNGKFIVTVLNKNQSDIPHIKYSVNKFRKKCL